MTNLTTNYFRLLLGFSFFMFIAFISYGQQNIMVETGYIKGLGNPDGIYERSAGTYSAPPSLGGQNTGCHCYTREGGGYSLVRIASGNTGYWAFFNIDHCPTAADNIQSIKNYQVPTATTSCNPAEISFIREHNMRLVVPAYKHPYNGVNNIANNVFWNKLNSAADDLSERLVVIISLPDPPSQGDIDAYKVVIDALQNRGATVLGYVPMYYAKNVQNMYAFKTRLLQKMKMWHGTFNIDGIFYDEAELTKMADLFAPLANETQSYNGGGHMVIFNPGVQTNDAVWNGHQAWFVPSESNEATFNGRKPTLAAMKMEQKSRSVILVHGVNASTPANWENQYNYLRNNGFSNIYLTDDIQVIVDDKETESPFDALPTFFDALVDKMK